MKNTLIINLAAGPDFLGMTRVLETWKSKNPDSLPSLLVWKEQEAWARFFSPDSKIFTLDRLIIADIIQTSVFPKSLAINLLSATLEYISAFPYDEVCVLSCNPASATIASLITSKNISGVSLSDWGIPTGHNRWSTFQYQVFSKTNHLPFHLGDLLLKIANLREETTVLTSNKVQGRKWRIGALLSENNGSNPVNSDIIEEFISLLKNYEDFTLVTTEIMPDHKLKCPDPLQLKALIETLDILVTNDIHATIVANSLNTPCLTIPDRNFSIHQHGPSRSGDLILTRIASSPPAEMISLDAADLLQSLLHLAGIKRAAEIELNENVLLYQATNDKYGIRYRPVAGDIDAYFEISSLAKRVFLHAWFGQTPDTSLMNEAFSAHTPDELKQWAACERNALETLLSLSSALWESIKNQKPNQKNIKTLAMIFDYAQTQFLISIPVMIFQSTVMAPGPNAFKNLPALESALFELKSNLGKTRTFLDIFSGKEKPVSTDLPRYDTSAL